MVCLGNGWPSSSGYILVLIRSRMWICDHFSTSINITQIQLYRHTIYFYSAGGATAHLSNYAAHAVSGTVQEFWQSLSSLSTFCISTFPFSSTKRDFLSSRIDDAHLFVRLSVYLFVCLSPKCKKTRFSQKLSNLELWCLLTTYRKLCKLNWAFQRTHYLLDPYNPRWMRSAILKIDMTSFFSAEGGMIWIKFRRLVQNDMSTAVMCGNGTRCRNPIWRTFGRIQRHVIPNLLRLCGEKTILKLFILETAEYQLSLYLLYYSWLRDSEPADEVCCRKLTRLNNITYGNRN